MKGLKIIVPVVVLAVVGGAIYAFLQRPGAVSPTTDPPSQAASSTQDPAAQTAHIADAPVAEASDYTPEGARVLDWMDLLPEGETERLQQLYLEYYEELEKKWAEDSGGPLDPAGPLAMIAEGSAADTMPQLGTYNVVEAFDGQTIRLPGYIVPLNFDIGDRYTEFLLVPYFGACLHLPPPPPNQIVYVRADPAVLVEEIWQPFWIEGTMRTETHKNDTGNAAYTVILDKLEAYGI